MAGGPPALDFAARSDGGAAGEVLLVVAAGELRSLAVEVVREVVALGDLTPVPRAPTAVLGVTQVRGQVVPVLDAAASDGAAEAREVRLPRAGDPLVIVEVNGVRAALAVEKTLGVSTPAQLAASGPGQGSGGERAVPLDAAALLARVQRRLEAGTA